MSLSSEIIRAEAKLVTLIRSGGDLKSAEAIELIRHQVEIALENPKIAFLAHTLGFSLLDLTLIYFAMIKALPNPFVRAKHGTSLLATVIFSEPSNLEELLPMIAEVTKNLTEQARSTEIREFTEDLAMTTWRKFTDKFGEATPQDKAASTGCVGLIVAGTFFVLAAHSLLQRLI
jgi:hypothetical protein